MITDKLQIARLVNGLTSYGNAWKGLHGDIADDFLKAAALITKQAEQLTRADGLVAALEAIKQGWYVDADPYNGEPVQVQIDPQECAAKALAEWGME